MFSYLSLVSNNDAQSGLNLVMDEIIKLDEINPELFELLSNNLLDDLKK